MTLSIEGKRRAVFKQRTAINGIGNFINPRKLIGSKHRDCFAIKARLDIECWRDRINIDVDAVIAFDISGNVNCMVGQGVAAICWEVQRYFQ